VGAESACSTVRNKEQPVGGRKNRGEEGGSGSRKRRNSGVIIDSGSDGFCHRKSGNGKGKGASRSGVGFVGEVKGWGISGGLFDSHS
jgi:hypothetical protein